jgi:hypothetical protein
MSAERAVARRAEERSVEVKGFRAEEAAEEAWILG